MWTEGKLKRLLKGVPEELHYIFIKSTSLADVLEFEKACIRLKKQEEMRQEVMKVQKKHGLPLEPNASYSRVQTRLRLKKKIEEVRGISGSNQSQEGGRSV